MGQIRARARRVAVQLSGGRILSLQRRLLGRRFKDSSSYWEDRYARGGTSGAGSYGESARAKAAYLNAFVERHGVTTVLELGCGDGAQLELAAYPSYVGFDVSPTIIDKCRARFRDDPGKEFALYEPEGFAAALGRRQFDLALSLDVVYHLVEDEVYRAHIEHLFANATRYVIVYSTDAEVAGQDSAVHVRHRAVAADIASWIDGWELIDRAVGVPASADEPAVEFLVFQKRSGRPA